MKKRPLGNSVDKRTSSRIFDYSPLEDRKLLAADIAPVSFDFSTDSGLIRTLETPVPMQDRFDVLRDVVDAGGEDVFRRISLERDALGFAHIKHQQFHDNVPIEGATYTVHIKDQQVVSVSGAFVEYDLVDSDSALNEAEALSSALDYVDADLYMWESLQNSNNHDPNCNCCDCLAGGSHSLGGGHYHGDGHDHGPYSDQLPTGEQIYLPGADGDLQLTWMFDVYAVEPLSRQHIFVDAGSGQILETHNQIHHADVAADGTSLYDGTVEFTAEESGTDFRLRQVTNGVETYDLQSGTSYNAAIDLTSASTSFTTTDVQTGVQAHFGAEQTLQYFQTEHGRDSYDGNGAVLRSYVSYSPDGNGYVNAFWDGSRMTYGDGDGVNFGPLVSLDIVGHEVAHGVTGNSAGLIYQNESGALNESFSDIFGEAIEHYALGTNNWLMGHDIGINGSGALRSMSNPNQFNDPDTYQGDSWFTGTSDNGGVHTNSGVQNKWFYILSEGESGTNDNGDAYSVSGIGIQDAGEIAYRNLSVYLNQSSNYAEAREGAIQSAIDLFGAGSAQVEATAAAWDAVGVYAPAPPEFSFNTVQSLGSSIYQSNLTGEIDAGSTTDIFLDIDANQKFSLQVTGSNGLVPTIELRDPSGTLVGSNTGNSALLQNMTIDTSGTYVVSISGSSSSSGNYEAFAVLNSGIEAEWQLGTSNDSLATAESLENSVVSFGADTSIERLAVTAVLEGQNPDFEASFESGSLGSEWTTASSTGSGRIRVSNAFDAADGNFSLLMDVNQNDTFTLNEAILTVDINPATNPVLTFSHAEWSDETHTLPDSFTGSADGDGVAISADGTTWYTILTGTDAAAGVWTEELFDLQAVADSVGITLGSSLQIKFQQYDNWPTDDDGRAYDAIQVTPQQSADDWYAFDVAADQKVSLTTNPVLGLGNVSVSLYDSSGNVVQRGSSSTNFQSAITDFSDASGGTYYARVEGDLAVEYSLVVTRGGAIDIEPNDVTDALPIDQYEGAIGFVSGLSSGSADPDRAENGEQVSGLFEGVTLSNPVNGGEIYAPFATFAPTGDRVFGPSATGSDGFRESDREFQANFHNLQSSVSIDIGSDDGSDVGFLRAFDAQGNLLEELVSGSLSTGQSETLTISRSTPDIAFIVAAGVGTDVTPLDNLTFSGAADTDHFSVELGVGDILTLDASLPGAGPFLFDNGLDQASSQLRVELVDPEGTSVAIDSSSIEHTAAIAGTWKINVSAISNEGEYLLRHNVQSKVDVTGISLGDGTNNRSIVDQLTLNFDGIVDLQQGALSLIQRETGQAVDLDWTIDNSSGQSQVLVTFSGALTVGSGSLVDGNYELTVDGSLFGSSAFGDDFVYGDNETDAFYRHFGDADGNRLVNVFDLLSFRKTFGLADGDTEFDGRFDNNGDGLVNVFDLLQFRQNFGETLPFN